MKTITPEYVQLLLDGDIAFDTHWSFVWYYVEAAEGEPDSERYITVMTECRMCGQQQMSSHPTDVWDDNCLQCSNCDHMTCEPMTDDVVTIEQTYEARGGPTD